MRIIGGEARGRRLYAPEGLNTRPTADRTREALFNILAPRVYGARVFDAFAGSGAMSLEAISRGAAGAHLCECDRAACEIIRKNVALCGYGEKAKLYQAEWQKALARMAGARFDLVFLDPPYRMLDAYGEVLCALRNGGFLAEGAVAALEMTREARIEPPEGFVCFDERQYGAARVLLLRAAGEA